MRLLAPLVPVLALSLLGCPKKDAPKPVPTLPGPAKEVEAEFVGTWKPLDPPAAAVTFTVQLEPCLPVPQKPTRLGEEKLVQPGNFFAEFFLDRGTRGHLCVYATDERGKVVGAAAYPKNPVTFEGDGEFVTRGIDVELKPVP